jgi:hypothetical protein
MGAGMPAEGIRVGIMARGAGGDVLVAPTLTQTTGGTATASYNASGEATTLYFFDLVGFQEGDVIEFSGGPNGGNHNTYMGMTFDVIPEPATMGLLAMGGLALLKRRRR